MIANYHCHFIFLVFRILLGLGFLYIGLDKLLRLDEFVRDVASFQIIFPPYDAFVAFFVPWVEVLCGVLILFALWYRGALMLLGSFIIVFITLWVVVLARGVDINCGCLPSYLSLGPVGTLILDIFLLLVVATLHQEFRYWKRYTFGGEKLLLPRGQK